MERYYVIFNGYHDFIFAEPKTLKPTQLAAREIQIARIGVFQPKNDSIGTLVSMKNKILTNNDIHNQMLQLEIQVSTTNYQ